VKIAQLFKCKSTSALFAVMFAAFFPVSGQCDPTTDYRHFCSVCHGESGDGRTHAMAGLSPPPRSFRTPGLKDDLSRESMIEIVSHGKPGTAMVAWESRLEPSRVSALIDYIRDTFMSASADTAQRAKNHSALGLYMRACENCHGADGSGSAWTRDALVRPPMNFRSEQAAMLSPERIRFSIANGRPGTAMPAYAKRFSDAQIAELSDFVWTVLMERQSADTLESLYAPRLEPNAPMPGGLQGNSVAGAEVYRENCAACHGESGAGDGPRARFVDPPPQPLAAAGPGAPALNRPALFYVIRAGVPGRSMPAMGAVLTDQQIADVAEYLFTALVPVDTDP
jgi:mono/diheme cytochrome c family protein